jgi:hypothetical protein
VLLIDADRLRLDTSLVLNVPHSQLDTP